MSLRECSYSPSQARGPDVWFFFFFYQFSPVSASAGSDQQTVTEEVNTLSTIGVSNFSFKYLIYL